MYNVNHIIPFLNSRYLSKSSLPEKCLYSELFWPVFPRILTEYTEIFRIPYLLVFSPNAEIADQNNSKYRHVLRSSCLSLISDFQRATYDVFKIFLILTILYRIKCIDRNDKHSFYKSLFASCGVGCVQLFIICWLCSRCTCFSICLVTYFT